ncbi:MAG: sarcosine oxidase subunit gamma [Planctomycetota bacterium]|nr:sarcosine oxidase subunit gamma [Planctomycetota bacterium]
MSESSLRRHGLEPLLEGLTPAESGDPGLKVSLRADLGHINLRGDPDSQDFTAAVATVLGQPLPVEANTWTEGKHRVLWLGPDEWLIVTPAEIAAHLPDSLEVSLAKQHAAVNDLSGGLLTVRIAGERVRDLLAKGCTLDLHPAEFEVGQCAQSGLAKANVLLAYVEAPSTFDITIRRSFSDYLFRWLKHAGREYGIEFD